jgi:hypothetical protein
MNKSYDVYMCRPDNRPTLYKVRAFEYFSDNRYLAVHDATGARDADIFQSYLADEQKRRVEPLFDGQIGTETRAVSKHRCVQSALWWLK